MSSRRQLSLALLVLSAALALGSLYQRRHPEEYRGVRVPGYSPRDL